MAVQKSDSEKSAQALRRARRNGLRLMGQNIVTGFVVALVMALISFVGAGGVQAFAEFKGHLLFVHPFMWTLTLATLSLIVSLQGAVLRGRLFDWVAKPILRFSSDVFGVALGAMPVFVVSTWIARTHGTLRLGEFVVPVVMSLLISLLATIGLEVASEPDVKTSEATLFGFLVLGLATLVASGFLLQSGVPSETALVDFGDLLSDRMGAFFSR